MSSRVIVVDDDLATLSLMHDVLAPEGYRVDCASTFEAGLRAAHQERPDLIILDLHLETSGAGWRLAERLRAECGTADIPIIVCSADHRALWSRSTELRERGIAMLEKPFDLSYLLGLVAAASTGPTLARQIPRRCGMHGGHELPGPVATPAS